MSPTNSILSRSVSNSNSVGICPSNPFSFKSNVSKRFLHCKCHLRHNTMCTTCTHCHVTTNPVSTMTFHWLNSTKQPVRIADSSGTQQYIRDRVGLLAATRVPWLGENWYWWWPIQVNKAARIDSLSTRMGQPSVLGRLEHQFVLASDLKSGCVSLAITKDG
jgi:hypothetical protein